jgi:phosphoribosylanthranilate isomerase
MSQGKLKIKVCGMRDPQNLEQLCALGPDYVGFIFYPPSKRYVGNAPDPALFRIPGPAIKKVGVFVDADLRDLRKIIDLYGLDAAQLHGNESVDYCGQLSMTGPEVIKVLDPHTLDSEIMHYSGVADYLLFDSAGTGSGGTGRKFNWDLLRGFPVQAPFFLSGGIGPDDAGQVRTLAPGGLAGVDVNSRFELAPGIKDIELLKEFFMDIRK